MLMIGQVEFLEIINLLEENYNKKISDNIIRIWYDEFKNCDKDILRKAIIKCIKDYSYFPTINQIKEQMNVFYQYKRI